ncbi:response regulator [bacterium]|nr:response regulator [bacterium]
MAKILVVDDEAPFRSFLSDVIKRIKHQAVEAENGRVAWDIYQKEKIDICLVDVNMPEMDGIGFLDKVKKEDPASIVIMMTGFPTAETIIETIEDDGFTYISKPVDVPVIIDLIERGLAARKKRIAEFKNKKV